MKFSIGIVAPSAVVPQVELKISVNSLAKHGLDVTLHKQCKAKHLFFAGSDSERAKAFFEYAQDPCIDVIWAARGGYGAGRILPLLDEMTKRHGKPTRKLFVGYSDGTALHNYVRSRWGWSVLHAPMPGLGEFNRLSEKALLSILRFVRGENQGGSVQFQLKKLCGKSRLINGKLFGGNLTVLVSQLGTPFFPNVPHDILFLEDVSEAYYRLDRMVNQFEMAGGFTKTKAIVLGTFDDCNDVVPNVLVSARSEKRKPLRRKISIKEALLGIWEPVSKKYELPIYYGLPVGHGKGLNALPLAAEYSIDREDKLVLKDWDWF